MFEEERELTVMLVVDFSRSGSFGTVTATKNDIAAEICAVLAFSAIKNNDKVGLILFTDRIEKFVPPKKGRAHILRIIRELISFEPTGTGTSIRQALEYFNHVHKKRTHRLPHLGFHRRRLRPDPPDHQPETRRDRGGALRSARGDAAECPG